MIELYMLELSQDRYSPHIISELRKTRQQRKNKEQHDKDILARLDKYTATDEDLKPRKSKNGR